MKRREFINQSGQSWLGAMAGATLTAQRAAAQSHDVLVYGATPAGIAAAIAARRGGASVAIAEASAHVGGRFAEALGFDETRRMDDRSIGGLFAELRAKVDRHYGQPTVTPEPHVHEAIIARWLAAEGVTIIRNFQIARVEKRGRRLTALLAEDGRRLQAQVFVDASYMGDLLPLARVPATVGREPVSQYRESLAGVRLTLKNPPGVVDEPIHHSPVSPFAADGRTLLPLMQGRVADSPPEGRGDRHLQCANLLACLTRNPANRVTIEKPDNYDSAQFELLRRELNRPGAPVGFGFGAIPNQKGKMNDIIPRLVTWGMAGGVDDYPTATPAERRRIIARHRHYTHSLLYFLQNDSAVPEALRQRMREWGLPKDEFVDNGHWPYDIYAREGRRMLGAYILRQRDLYEDRAKPDAVTLGSFPVDSHMARRLAMADGGVINEGGFLVKVPLHQLPYRSLTPNRRDAENLLVPVALSASRVAFCSVRVEPTWMALGQAAGAAAALAVADRVPVQRVNYQKLRARLLRDGQALELPTDERPIRQS